jgi:hypothetical protein
MSGVPITTGTWETSNNNSSGSCSLSNGVLNVTANPSYFHVCLNLNTNARNFALESQMTIKSGECGGLVFRSGGSNSTALYYYVICADNSFRLDRHTSNTDQSALVDTTIPSSSGISVGLSQTYSIAVVANGSTFTLYVNNKQIYKGSDSSFTSGTIGVLARGNDRSGGASTTSVQFSNVRIYKF